MALALIAWAGCGRREAPRSDAPPAKTRAVAASVSFVRGEGRAYTDSAWKPLAIGMELEAADSLEIAEGALAELKGADGQVAKLAGPAKGSVQEMISAAAARDSSAAGQVLSKVKKLEGGRRTYSAQTPTAVAGIRGVKARATVPDTTKKDSLPQK